MFFVTIRNRLRGMAERLKLFDIDEDSGHWVLTPDTNRTPLNSSIADSPNVSEMVDLNQATLPVIIPPPGETELREQQMHKNIKRRNQLSEDFMRNGSKD